MIRILLFITSIFVVGCAIPPDVKVNRELGRHPLPYRANERFVLTNIIGAAVYGEAPSSIEYFLDGRRRTFKPAKVGSTDGYITYLGRLLAPEIDGVESPIMDEQVIRLRTGEEITVDGNTVDSGGIRLRKQQAEQDVDGNPLAAP